MQTVLAVFLLAAGVYFTGKTRFVQFRRFLPACKTFFRSDDRKDQRVSPFEAAATSLAASLGAGNMAGVAGAILAGGAGAIFWMWMSALVGMALKYAEIFYAVRYRRREGDIWRGGPMAYIERGLDRRWHILAVIFAFCGMLASLGMGNLAQVNTVSDSVQTVASVLFGDLSDRTLLSAAIVTGILAAIVIAFAVLGGNKRVGRFSALLVPLMSVLYIGGALIIILSNRERILPALQNVIKSAFCPQAAMGGTVGITFQTAFRVGISRGVFTHEAGMGTSAIAHAAADAASPERQALYGVFEVFLDTIVMCTLTALAILVSGVPVPYGNDALAGVLVADTFATSFGDVGASMFLALSLMLFAFSSMLGFSLYGSECAVYLFGRCARKPYLLAFSMLCILGAVLPLSLVWRIAESLNMVMAVPNLIALILLSRRT